MMLTLTNVIVFLACNDAIKNLKIKDVLEKLLHNVNNRSLKYLCKFQVDIPKSAKVIAVQSLGNLHTLYCRNHVGGPKNAHQPIFPYT